MQAIARDVFTIARLYEAGLDRDGDLDRPGLNFWIDVFERGSTLDFISDLFLRSPEFAQAANAPVDTLTDRQLVERLYLNVLDREGEQAGVDFWTNELASGVRSRENMLLQFAISPENVASSGYVEGLMEEADGSWWFSAADAVDDAVTVAEDASIEVPVLVNDTGNGLSLVSFGNPASGTVELADLDAGTIRYTPAANFAGADSFTYTITDSEGRLDTATVTLDVTDDDGANTRAEAAPFTVGQTFTGETDGLFDRDFYRIDAASGEAFSVFALGGASSAAIEVGLWTAQGDAIASSDGDVINYAPDPGVTEFFVSVAASQTQPAGGPETGTYFLNVNPLTVAEDVPGTRFTPIQVDLTEDGSWGLLADRSQLGVIEDNRDADWYGIQLFAGRDYRFELSRAGTDPVTDVDLSLREIDGSEVASARAVGDDALDFSPESSSQYFIEVVNFNASGNLAGTYDLNVFEL